MFWKDNFIIKMLGIITSSISKCQYQINGSWYDAQAELISLDRNNAVYSVDIPADVSGVIDGLRLVDSSGIIAGERSENTVKKSGKEMNLRMKISLKEAT